MLEEYIYHGSEKLRCGYTTGSCAAAAAKAAVYFVLSGSAPDRVFLPTPKGIDLSLDVIDPVLHNESSATCSIRKDGGDDPDITNGILVKAYVEKIPSGTVIDGGEGIGRVTRKGLNQPVGAAAINSTPRRMIAEAVCEVCEEFGYSKGFRVVISIPGGEKLALKTYNPRIGIEGGISILGTSGIVEPMSSAALIETIRTEERIARAAGKKHLLLTIGNYGEIFLKDHSALKLENGVKCSNYIGEAIDGAAEFGFEGILIVGHVGKLVKLGAGIMNTHSSQADGRMDVLVTCGLLAGADAETLKKIPPCVTVDEALEILDAAGVKEKTAEALMEKTQFYLDAKVKHEIEIGAVMFSNKYGIIGKTACAEGLMEKIAKGL